MNKLLYRESHYSRVRDVTPFLFLDVYTGTQVHRRRRTLGVVYTDSEKQCNRCRGLETVVRVQDESSYVSETVGVEVTRRETKQEETPQFSPFTPFIVQSRVSKRGLSLHTPHPTHVDVLGEEPR